MNPKPFVLCVAAWSGGGKTTVVNALLRALGNARAVYFDSYHIDFLRQEYYQWSINGNDYNEWHLEPIACDIERLLSEDVDYILLDLPMGNRNDLIAKYIDYTVFLDAPADVLLARTVIRDYCRRDPGRRKLDNPLERLAENLTNYLAYFRVTVLNYIEAVKPYADCVIDGCQPVDDLAREIANLLHKVNPPQ